MTKLLVLLKRINCNIIRQDSENIQRSNKNIHSELVEECTSFDRLRMMRFFRMVKLLRMMRFLNVMLSFGLHSVFSTSLRFGLRNVFPITSHFDLRVSFSAVSRAALCLVFILSLYSAPAFAQDNPKITKKVFDNGLTLVVKPEPDSGLVSIVALVRVGAAQETIQTAGIGNFVAQLLLASTRKNSAEDFAAIASEVGGNIDSGWTPDYIQIRTVTTADSFDRAMKLIGESLNYANFESKWVEQVRAELLKKYNTEQGNVYQQAYDKLRSLLYVDNGYNRPMLGYERTIKLVTKDDLHKFYKTYFVPGNIFVSVVGDVTADKAIDRTDKVFIDMIKKDVPKVREIPDEVMARSRSFVAEADIRVAYTTIGWLAPSFKSADYPAAAVLTSALGAGKGSLMFRELRQQKNMGYDVGADYPRLLWQSHIAAYAVTDPYKYTFPAMTPSLNMEDVKNEMIDLASSLKEKPLSKTDLDRAKGYTKGIYALSHQHLLDRADSLARLEASGLGYETYYNFDEMIDKVTAQDVQNAAKKYFNNYAIVIFLPKSFAEQPEEK